jgi:hypothetical protein
MQVSGEDQGYGNFQIVALFVAVEKAKKGSWQNAKVAYGNTKLAAIDEQLGKTVTDGSTTSRQICIAATNVDPNELPNRVRGYVAVEETGLATTISGSEAGPVDNEPSLKVYLRQQLCSHGTTLCPGREGVEHTCDGVVAKGEEPGKLAMAMGTFLVRRTAVVRQKTEIDIDSEPAETTALVADAEKGIVDGDYAYAYEHGEGGGNGGFVVWEFSKVKGSNEDWERCSPEDTASIQAAKKKGAAELQMEVQDSTLLVNLQCMNENGYLIMVPKTKETLSPDLDPEMVKGAMRLRRQAVDIAYLSDGWNALDFFVVLTSWPTLILEVAEVQLPIKTSSLRALRVMRVMRSMRFFSGIRMIIGTLAKAFAWGGQVWDIAAFLVFVYLILGIIGVQMFRGHLLYRCSKQFPVPDSSGHDYEWMGIGDLNWQPYCYPEMEKGNSCANACTTTTIIPSYNTQEPSKYWSPGMECPACYESATCKWGTKCHKFGNPGFGHHGFDNMIMAIHATFIMMTNLYWWETAYQLEDTDAGLASNIAWIFGLIVVFILSWVAINMFVAVICSTWDEMREECDESDDEGEDDEAGGTYPQDYASKGRKRGKHWDSLAWGNVSSHKLLANVGGDDSKKAKDAQKAKELADEIRLRTAPQLRKAPQAGKKRANCAFLCWQNKGDVEAAPLIVGQKPDGSDDVRTEVLARRPPYYVSTKLGCTCSKLMLQPLFENIILFFILLNTVALALEHHNMSTDLIASLAMSGHVFNGVFDFECIVKILGMGFCNYQSVPFNNLDLFIVVTSNLNYLGDILPGASVARLLRIFRLFRVAKVIRMLYKYKSMKRLLQTVFASWEPMANLMIFILVTVTVFALMGMHLFGNNVCKEDESCAYLDGDDSNGELQRRNWETFGQAWLMAFQVLTGDDWCNQMYAYVNVAGVHAAVFFAICFSFTNYVLMNLFIAVILENFAIANEAKEAKQIGDDRNKRMNVVCDNIEGKEPDDNDDANCADCCRCHKGRSGCTSKENDTALFCFDGRRNKFFKPDEESVKEMDITLYSVSREKLLVQDNTPNPHCRCKKLNSATDWNYAYIVAEKRWDDTFLWVTYDVQTVEIDKQPEITSRLKQGTDWHALNRLVEDLDQVFQDQETEIENMFADENVLKKFRPPSRDSAGIQKKRSLQDSNLTPEQQEVKSMFLNHKKTGAEFMGKGEIRGLLEELNLISADETDEKKEELAQRVMIRIDTNFNDEVDFDEFLVWWMSTGKYLKTELKWNATIRSDLLNELVRWKNLVKAAKKQLAVVKVEVGDDRFTEPQFEDFEIELEPVYGRPESCKLAELNGRIMGELNEPMRLLIDLSEQFFADPDPSKAAAAAARERRDIPKRVVEVMESSSRDVGDYREIHAALFDQNFTINKLIKDDDQDAIRRSVEDTLDQLHIKRISANAYRLTEHEEYASPVRKLAERIANNSYFEVMVMVAILVSSVLLAYEGPDGNIPDGTDAKEFLSYIDTTFYGIFMFEFVVKLVAFGFYFTPNAYLMDGWNRLDFVVVVFSTIGYLPGQENSPFGRILRLGRCLRPLRMINKNPNLKVIVTAIIESMATNTAVLGLSFLLFLIFGILGCNLFGGKFYYCTCSDAVGAEVWDTTRGNLTWAEMEAKFDWPARRHGFESEPEFLDRISGLPVGSFLNGSLGLAVYPYLDPSTLALDFKSMNDRVLCQAQASEGCEWLNKPYNYDNIGQALMAMFTASTLAGWTDIMEISIDATGIDKEPVTNASPLAAVYWVLFVFILAFFVTNLFLGVLIDFIGQSDGSAFQTEDQQQWSDLTRNIGNATPPTETLREPDDLFRKICSMIVLSTSWENLSNLCIILNVIVMMFEYEGQESATLFGEDYSTVLDHTNDGFLYFFTLEMLLKLIALGPRMYWSDPWNKFDGAVVTLSWLGIIFNFKAQVARAFRAFRIVLVLKSATGLQSLFRTLIMSIPPSLNICALLFLLYSLYAILGMQIFGTEILRDRLGEFGQMQQTRHSNFQNYPNAMKLLFECSAGKDWKIVMYEVYDEAPVFCFLYFFSFFFFAVYILTNMFVAVIIDNFSSCLREGSLPIKLSNMTVFRDVWKAHAIFHDMPDALRIRRGDAGYTFIRQVLKDVGMFDGDEQEGARLEREHFDLMDEYELCPPADINERTRLYKEAQNTLNELKKIESAKFHAMLKDAHKRGVEKRDFNTAENMLKQMEELDALQRKGGSARPRPSVEDILKTGNKMALIKKQYMKEMSTKEVEAVKDALDELEANRREDLVDGLKFTDDELKRWDKGRIQPYLTSVARCLTFSA